LHTTNGVESGCVGCLAALRSDQVDDIEVVLEFCNVEEEVFGGDREGNVVAVAMGN
jgi:hypothetical protein